MSNRYFIFAGENSNSYGVHVFEANTYNAPARSYNSNIVPGKDGNLLTDNKRYDNTTHEFMCIISENFESRVQEFRSFLNSKVGYNRLEDSGHPDEYYLACYKDSFVVTTTNNLNMGKMSVTFERKPQRFLKSGEQAVSMTSSGSISNPTKFSAKPLVRIYGTGRVGIGDNAITVTSASSYTDVDCDIMEAYSGTQSRNGYIQIQNNDFPVLKPGANGITLGAGITRVEITPRWWRL